MKSVTVRGNTNVAWAAPYAVTFRYAAKEGEDIEKLQLSGDFQFFTRRQAKAYLLQGGAGDGLPCYNAYQWEPGMILAGCTVDGTPSVHYDMVKGDDGVYTVTIPLPDGQYHYYFVVTRSDGTTEIIPDPENLPDMNEFHKAYHCQLSVGSFKLAGELGYGFKRTDGKCGRKVFDSYTAIDGTTQPVSIYLPYGFDPSKKYRVVYVCHGGGGNELEWFNAGCMAEVFDNVIAKGGIVPCIGVTSDNAYFKWDFEKIAENLFKCVIPFVEEKYNVAPGAENRAYCGLSMGSETTLHMYMKHNREFYGFGAFSGGSRYRPTKEETDIIRGGPHLYLSCGNLDMAYVNATYGTDKDISVTGLRNWLDANEIPYTFHLKDGAHDFNVWIKTLAEFLQYSLWKE